MVLDTTCTNLPILHLNGTPFENGFQHGRVLKDKIIRIIGLWKEELEINYQIPADEFIKIFLDSTGYLTFRIKRDELSGYILR